MRLIFDVVFPAPMKQEDIDRVQSSWAKITPNGEDFAKRFYQNLFEIDPVLQSLFKRSMDMQSRKLMSMFDLAVEYMEQTDKFIPPLAAAGKRHIQYGVKAGDFDTVGRALIQTLAETLGDEFDEPTRLAWEKAYKGIKNIMMPAGYE